MLPDAGPLAVLGRFIRTTSLDEIPQLLNVIKGRISLMGQRPFLVGEQKGPKGIYSIDDCDGLLQAYEFK